MNHSTLGLREAKNNREKIPYAGERNVITVTLATNVEFRTSVRSQTLNSIQEQLLSRNEEGSFLRLIDCCITQL